ncbi:MAG: CHC2 zinc finger domain-containing protein, partial [Cyanobacteria bacterium J06606_4]
MGNPRIHPDTIDEVRQRADIVDIVSEQVVLKKQGKDFV